MLALRCNDAGDILRLRLLSDEESDRAETLAVHSLHKCPTCKTPQSEMSRSEPRFAPDNNYRSATGQRRCYCDAQIALYMRYLLANIGDGYMRLDWSKYEGAANGHKFVTNYLAHWPSFRDQGIGLMFHAPTLGAGKTWAVSHIGKELIKRNERVYFINFTAMIDRMCSDDAELEARMKRATCLIIDDIVTGISERQRDLYALKFEVVLRHRSDNLLPTLTTTNLNEDSFEREFPRLYSLLAPIQFWVDMTGEDHRKKRSLAIEDLERRANREIHPIT